MQLTDNISYVISYEDIMENEVEINKLFSFLLNAAPIFIITFNLISMLSGFYLWTVELF